MNAKGMMTLPKKLRSSKEEAMDTTRSVPIKIAFDCSTGTDRAQERRRIRAFEKFRGVKSSELSTSIKIT